MPQNKPTPSLGWDVPPATKSTPKKVDTTSLGRAVVHEYKLEVVNGDRERWECGVLVGFLPGPLVAHLRIDLTCGGPAVDVLLRALGDLLAKTRDENGEPFAVSKRVSRVPRVRGRERSK